jgi:hypothetical protein
MKRLFHHCATPPTTPVNTPPQELSEDECDDLQSSLKRVRISTSPGELRLDRDLQQLGWSSSHRHLTNDVVVNRSHALGIVVHVAGAVRIQLDFSRLYPHSGPTIARMDGATAATAASLAVIEWSPIMTLGDYLSELLRQLSETTHMAIDAIDAPMKYQTLFSENRFDVGYIRPTTMTDSSSTAADSSSTRASITTMEC